MDRRGWIVSLFWCFLSLCLLVPSFTCATNSINNSITNSTNTITNSIIIENATNITNANNATTVTVTTTRLNSTINANATNENKNKTSTLLAKTKTYLAKSYRHSIFGLIQLPSPASPESGVSSSLTAPNKMTMPTLESTTMTLTPEPVSATSDAPPSPTQVSQVQEPNDAPPELVPPTLPICDFDINNQFVVNDDTAFLQTSSAMAILRNVTTLTNQVVVTWQGTQDGSGLGVQAALFQLQPDGVVVSKGPMFQVNTNSLFDQKLPKVAALNFGEFAIAFESTLELPDATGTMIRQQRVLVQLYTNDATPLGGEFLVNDSPLPRHDIKPSIAAIYSETGGFIVTWISSPLGEQASARSGSLHGRVFNSDSTPRSPVFQINTLSDLVTPAHAIAALENGNAIAVWTSRPAQGGCTTSRSIAAQLLNGNGQPIGSQFPVNDFSSMDQFDPTVAGLENGGFVVSWTSLRPDGTSQIYVQLFDDKSARMGASFAVNQNTSFFQSDSVVVGRVDSAFLVLWSSFDLSTGSSLGIFGQLVDGRGDLLGTQFQASFVNGGNQYLPASVIFPDNKMMITWTENGDAILGRIFSCAHNCSLSEWSPWGECSATCGGGTQTRSREVAYPPVQGGQPCDGPLVESRECNLQPCTDPLCSSCFRDSCYRMFTRPRSYSASVDMCQRVRGCPPDTNCLAAVESQTDRAYLVNEVANGTEAWIGTWQGSDYGGLCLAMSPYGAITVPMSGCETLLAVICQVPRPANCVPTPNPGPFASLSSGAGSERG